MLDSEVKKNLLLRKGIVEELLQTRIFVPIFTGESPSILPCERGILPYVGGRDVTNMGGFQGQFPSTRWSMVLDARENSPEALETLCELYWKPIYLCLRANSSLHNEELKDQAQEFFLQVLEGKVLDNFSREKGGSFRAYIRGALQKFQTKQYRKKSTLKRGGDRNILNLDAKIDELSRTAHSADGSPVEIFEREWAQSLIENVKDGLRKELAKPGKENYFAIFDRYVLSRPTDRELTYEDVAKEFKVEEKAISKILVHCRDRMRRRTVNLIRDYVADETDVAMEYAEILELLR